MASSSFFLLCCLFGCCFLTEALATHYVVGGPGGWTTPARNQVNYTDWASSITFKVGDTLEFNYAAKSHTVLALTRSSFRYCNVTDPLENFTNSSGKSIVELSKPGNYYFVDGVGTHCNEGQKFQAKVLSSSTAASSSPSIASSPSSGAYDPALSPSSSMEAAEPSASPAIPPAVAAACSIIPSSLSVMFIAAIHMLLRSSC